VKPPKSTHRVAELRVTRKSNVHLAHGDGHGWAVSYADMLMVLLSFFVLFFSLDDNPAGYKAQMRMIAMAVNGKETLSSTGGKGLPGGPVAEADSYPDFSEEHLQKVATLADALKMGGLKIQNRGDKLVVDLEDATFGKGEYHVNGKLQEQVEKFQERLMAHKEEVALTIIGHTDDRPLRYRNELLADNFDLSSIRALTVLKMMVKAGFPKEQATARAAGQFERNSRSITFEVQIKRNSSKGDHS
jgi:flagellar motor protein MotB